MDRHPGDPRLPEALHRVVRATRFGCWSREAYGPTSKAAFQNLRSAFPNNPWTAKTLYWFN